MPRPWGNKGQHKLTGIVGVHPMAILMEHLDEPLLQAGGLGGLLQHLEAAGYDAQDLLLERQPYWLQDNHHHHHTAPHTQHNADGQCLGPAGFSDCGDATLWLIHRRQRRPHRRRPHQPQQRDRRKQPHESNHHSHSKGTCPDSTHAYNIHTTCCFIRTVLFSQKYVSHIFCLSIGVYGMLHCLLFCMNHTYMCM